jgi:hypothetical protein
MSLRAVALGGASLLGDVIIRVAGGWVVPECIETTNY